MPGPIPGVAAHLKILIVTDAWKPQVNGVVRTLEVLGEDLTALGHNVRYATPEGRFTIGLPTYPRNPPGAVSAQKAGTGDTRLRARRRAYRHRRHIGDERARHLPEARHRLLHLLSHPLSRICAGALSADPGGTGLSLAALVSRSRHRHDGGDRESAARDGGAWLHQSAHLVARRGCGPLSSRCRTRICLTRGRSGCMSAGSRWKRTSKPFWRWICRAPRWWSATARPAPRWKPNIPQARFLGALSGEALVQAYAGSTVFVFPSRTDTFGLVLLEALACGLPVAAYPVQGPLDVVGGAPVAALDDGPAEGLSGGPGDRPPPRRRHPPGLRRGAFLAGLHPAVPAQYHCRAGRGLTPSAQSAFRLRLGALG